MSLDFEKGRYKARRTVDREIDRALERFCWDVQDGMRQYNFTAKDARRALVGYPDFADAWDEYWMDEE